MPEKYFQDSYNNVYIKQCRTRFQTLRTSRFVHVAVGHVVHCFKDGEILDI